MNERRVRNAGRVTYGRQSPPTRRQGRKPVRIHLGLVQRRLLGLAIVLVAVLLILKQSFAINHVVVKADSRSNDIQVEAQKALDARWNQGNLLSFSSGTLSADLTAADPSIKGIIVRRGWPHTVNLTVTLKQPSLAWSSGNQAFVLDRDGTVIGTLPTGSTLPVVIDGSNLPVQVGKRVVSTRFVSFVSDISAALPKQGIKVTQLAVQETTLDLYVTTDKGYQLIFDTSRPAADEAGDLAKVLTTLSAQHKVPASYIDLRIAGKAYFK